MLFMHRFYRSYAFNHKSMGAQSHILRKHCPSMMISACIIRALRREAELATSYFYTAVVHIACKLLTGYLNEIQRLLVLRNQKGVTQNSKKATPADRPLLSLSQRNTFTAFFQIMRLYPLSCTLCSSASNIFNK